MALKPVSGLAFLEGVSSRHSSPKTLFAYIKGSVTWAENPLMTSDRCSIWLGIVLAVGAMLLGYAVALVPAGLVGR